jgi:hypothetical protein
VADSNKLCLLDLHACGPRDRALGIPYRNGICISTIGGLGIRVRKRGPEVLEAVGRQVASWCRSGSIGSGGHREWAVGGHQFAGASARTWPAACLPQDTACATSSPRLSPCRAAIDSLEGIHAVAVRTCGFGEAGYNQPLLVRVHDALIGSSAVEGAREGNSPFLLGVPPSLSMLRPRGQSEDYPSHTIGKEDGQCPQRHT